MSDTTHADEHNVAPTSKQDQFHQLALSLYVPVFAERPTIKEAYAYAQAIAQASDNPVAVTTAIHVMVNTIAKEIERINARKEA